MLGGMNILIYIYWLSVSQYEAAPSPENHPIVWATQPKLPKSRGFMVSKGGRRED
jgi:hypothetical protein